MRAPASRLLFAALAAVSLLPAPASAQSRPFYDCNLYGPTHSCDPYLLYPPGQDLRLTVRTREVEGMRRKDGAIDTLRDLFADLRACWRPPALEAARPGMELSVRFAFRRDGSIVGKPRFTYVSRAATNAQRDTYRQAVIDSLTACTPMPFGRGMGGAVAGRPIAIRFVDDRG